LEPLQWKLDSQISIVEAFKKLLEKRWIKHTKYWARLCL
jgi:hypothetical protein